MDAGIIVNIILEIVNFVGKFISPPYINADNTISFWLLSSLILNITKIDTINKN